MDNIVSEVVISLVFMVSSDSAIRRSVRTVIAGASKGERSGQDWTYRMTDRDIYPDKARLQIVIGAVAGGVPNKSLQRCKGWQS